LLALAEREGSVLLPRQALPDDAFLSFSQVVNLTSHNLVLPSCASLTVGYSPITLTRAATTCASSRARSRPT
jgi:hypothetical protein